MLVNSVNVYSISVRFHTLREEISIIATRVCLLLSLQPIISLMAGQLLFRIGYSYDCLCSADYLFFFDEWLIICCETTFIHKH